jgi:hypothetical protein
LEKLWVSRAAALRKVTKGHDMALDLLVMQAMLQRCHANTQLEKAAFLPLAQTLLGCNGSHRAA